MKQTQSRMTFFGFARTEQILMKSFHFCFSSRKKSNYRNIVTLPSFKWSKTVSVHAFGTEPIFVPNHNKDFFLEIFRKCPKGWFHFFRLKFYWLNSDFKFFFCNTSRSSNNHNSDENLNWNLKHFFFNFQSTSHSDSPHLSLKGSLKNVKNRTACNGKGKSGGRKTAPNTDARDRHRV